MFKFSPDWLNKNVASLLAIIWILVTVGTNFLILTHTVKAADNITYLIVTNVNNIALLIIGYFFGSSKSSKDKDTTITNLTNKTEGKDEG